MVFLCCISSFITSDLLIVASYLSFQPGDPIAIGATITRAGGSAESTRGTLTETEDTMQESRASTAPASEPKQTTHLPSVSLPPNTVPRLHPKVFYPSPHPQLLSWLSELSSLNHQSAARRHQDLIQLLRTFLAQVSGPNSFLAQLPFYLLQLHSQQAQNGAELTCF